MFIVEAQNIAFIVEFKIVHLSQTSHKEIYR
ncbi:MAG: hypothetical protein ACJAZP_002332 [Psychromonas sp.]|jgi:hypothetical protein